MTTKPATGTFPISSGFRIPDRPDRDGIDIAAPSGAPIYAPIDVVVIEGADRVPESVLGFGNWGRIDAQRERGIDLIFGHMRHSSILFRRGDRVHVGQQMATERSYSSRVRLYADSSIQAMRRQL